MRLKNYIIEDQSISNIIDHLMSDCLPYLKETRGQGFLYRGIKKHANLFDDIFVMDSRLTDRKPKDTPIKIHNLMNEMFVKKFGWPVRNGTFVTGDDNDALKYGRVFMFFPIGEYKYAWSQKYLDLYYYISSFAMLFRKDTEDQYSFITRPGNDIYKGVWLDEKGNKYGKTVSEVTQRIKIAHKNPLVILDKTPITKSNIYRIKVFFDVKKLESPDMLFYWKPDITFEKFKEKLKKKYDAFLDSFIDSYQDDDLLKAIKMEKEVSFMCDKYYIISDDVYMTLKKALKIEISSRNL